MIGYPFDSAQLLAKKRSIKRELLAKEGLVPKKVAIMSGSTVGEVKNMLELFLLDNGIVPEFYVGEYALWYENLVFDDGSLAAFKPDFIYIHTSMQNISNLPTQADGTEAIEEKLRAEMKRWQTAWAAAAKTGAVILQNNFDLPWYRVMGNMDATDVHGHVNFINRLNLLFSDYAAKTPNFYINDLHYLSAAAGIHSWFSPAVWYAYKYLCDTKHIPVLCHSLANIIKSSLGKNKKSVILDLDNTLWGGIIGDDGADGIELGEETPTGRAYTEFQAYLKELAGMGIMLNVCSKNEKDIALTGFARQDSVLKEKDFLCFKANWEPKHLNVATIAKEINIMPDSFVFMDDNPAERDIVKREIAGVTVPDITTPEEYIRVLDGAGYFEVTTLSADDKKRNEMYKQNLQRAEMEQSFGDYTDYLKSLAMHCEIGHFDAAHAERITQLINKTNQFNLTTRRYTAAEVESLIGNDEYITLYGRLVDKFGDNGIVTAMIGHKQGSTLEIDLWIMSCRTFKRNLEHAMFDAMVKACRDAGITQINGHYYPTAKNLLVSDFYATIGFDKTHEDESGRTFVFHVTDDYANQNAVMDVQYL